MEELQKLKEIYLTDVDSDLYQENLEHITKWEKELIANENMISWLSHDTTIVIKDQAKNTFIELAITLATDRKLTDVLRQSIYARQDACLWILLLGDNNPIQTIQLIKNDIKTALQAV